MRLLCVGRHQFLSEHLGRYFETLGVDTIPCVGVNDVMRMVADHEPDAVVCDYDLLATVSLDAWEKDPVLSRVPFIAVSLTRHPGEAHLLDVNGIAGFLYLPTLQREDAQRVLDVVRQRRGSINPPNALPWPGTTPVAQLH
ncbi:MAG TPA: hypothetical protein VK636_10595 [Gemmatimonadaceae bacterium]|nr:hypothetical protein [Gemmatimonadaceae bacterium]